MGTPSARPARSAISQFACLTADLLTGVPVRCLSQGLIPLFDLSPDPISTPSADGLGAEDQLFCCWTRPRNKILGKSLRLLNFVPTH